MEILNLIFNPFMFIIALFGLGFMFMFVCGIGLLTLEAFK